MGIFTALRGRISQDWKAQHLAARAERATRCARNVATFEALESRTHLNATAPAASSYADADDSVAVSTAYTFSLHPGATSFISPPGRASEPHFTGAFAGVSHVATTHRSTFSHGGVDARSRGAVDWLAEGEALAGTQLRASGTDPFMRPRRSNLVPSMGATPSAGAAEHPPERKPVVPPPATATRVLVIEDDAMTRKAMTGILRGRGFEVTVAATVAEGVRQLAARPHHVLLDLTLPDGDGERVLEHIRSTGLRTRVTITSGSDDADRLARVRELGADDVLSKPVHMGTLLNSLAVAA